MSGPVSSKNTIDSRDYFLGGHPFDSRLSFARWALTIPLLSWTGARALSNFVDQRVPDVWGKDLSDREVLIVGSGPSLDRVDDAFFDRFDAVLYINFALRRMRSPHNSYAFSTDLSPFREFIEEFGIDAFASLGPDRCIVAPIFLDQWHYVTPKGRELFTWLRYDRAVWKTQKASLGPLRVPYTLRYAPRQPNWPNFVLPEPGRTVPVLTHTSALTAMVFAAMNGARKIGLIGCDFSDGRSKAAESVNQRSYVKPFAGAAEEFGNLAMVLKKSGIITTNYSWEV